MESDILAQETSLRHFIEYEYDKYGLGHGQRKFLIKFDAFSFPRGVLEFLSALERCTAMCRFLPSVAAPDEFLQVQRPTVSYL